MFSNIINVLRIQDWIEKLQINALVGVLFLISIGFSNDFLLAIVFALIYQTLLGSYGHLLNSFTDRERDKLVGKNITFQNFPKSQAKLLLGLLALSSFFFPFLFNLNTILFGTTAFILATAYSIHPIRLKERGFIGVIFASLAETTLPFLFFASLTELNSLAIYLSIWLFLRLVLEELEHQRLDFKADKIAKSRSFAVILGLKKVKKLTMVFFILFMIYTIYPIIILGYYGLLISVLLSLFTIHSIRRFQKRFLSDLF